MSQPKIEHVVMIVKENHTFDNYFGSFGGGSDGMVLPQAPDPPPWDPDHKHQTWMNRATEATYRVQYGAGDIGGYFDLASRFTLCDRYFSEVAGPSTPNHLMLIRADRYVVWASNYAPDDAANAPTRRIGIAS